VKSEEKGVVRAAGDPIRQISRPGALMSSKSIRTVDIAILSPDVWDHTHLRLDEYLRKQKPLTYK
jgi:hypothetical protein